MSQPDDKTFFIGASVAYFFIGNKETYNNDIDEINDKFYLLHNKSLRGLELKLINLKAQGEPTSEIVEEYFDCFGKKRIKRMSKETAIEKYWKNIKSTEESIAFLTEYINNYVPLRDREITDSYFKEALQDGEVVKIEGIEEGRFWLKEEYETGYIEVTVDREGIGKKKIKVK